MTTDPRVAVVTGASSGIGRAIAVALGELGWRVALGARRSDELEETAKIVIEAGGEAFPKTLDVTDPRSIDAFVKAAEDGLGPIDALVNNAGIAIPGPFWELAPEQLEREVRTNLLGSDALHPASAARDDPRAAPATSSSSPPTPPARRVPACSDTARRRPAIEVVARTLAMELEGTGIRSTTVRVGPTLTDFASGWSPEQVEELMTYWPQFGIQRHFHTLQPRRCGSRGRLRRDVAARRPRRRPRGAARGADRP